MRNLILLICAAWLAAGCATPNRAHLKEHGGDVYADDQVDSFIADTQPRITSNDYIIGVGDRLDVAFFYNKDMTTTNLLVRTDGKITLPYLGDVVAAGYSPMQLDTLLTDRFSEILKEPNLSVIVRSAEDPMVFVLGQVEKPGAYNFKRFLSLTQAMALAGGPVRGAHTKQVLVLRREAVDTIVGVQVDLQSILDGQQIQGDLPLRNMDLVYVPKTALESTAQVMQAVQDIIAPYTSILQSTWLMFLMQDRLRE